MTCHGVFVAPCSEELQCNYNYTPTIFNPQLKKIDGLGKFHRRDTDETPECRQRSVLLGALTYS